MNRCKPACAPHESLFCPTCGRARPGELGTIVFNPFTGGASLSPAVEKFWATGNPEYTN